MLKSSGSSLLFKFGPRVCVCMRSSQLNAHMLKAIRPLLIGRFAFWCDHNGAA